MPKSAQLQNNSKNDSPSGPYAPLRGTIFLSEILMLVSSISYLSMVKKAKGFLMGKYSIQNIRSKILKTLRFCSLRDFFNFLQVITFDTFILAN